MLDPLRVKLITESASGLVSASISPSKATRNGVRLACVTCYEMLRFAPPLGHFTPILPSHRLCERQGPAATRYPRKEVAAFALVTTVGHQPRAARSTPGEPGRAADRQAFASLSYLTHRQVLRNPYIAKEGRHDPNIHSLRHCHAMFRPGTLVCLFSASLPYWRQRREECCTNPEALTSWTRLLPPARAQGFGTSCGSDRLSQGSPCPRSSGGDSRLPRRRMSPGSLLVSLFRRSPVSTTAS